MAHVELGGFSIPFMATCSECGDSRVIWHTRPIGEPIQTEDGWWGYEAYEPASVTCVGCGHVATAIETFRHDQAQAAFDWSAF